MIMWLILGFVGWMLLCYESGVTSIKEAYSQEGFWRGFLFALLLGPIGVLLFVDRKYNQEKITNKIITFLGKK